MKLVHMEAFQFPPTIKQLGEAVERSYHTAADLANSGVAPTITYTGERHIEMDWANDFVRCGLTPDEQEQLRIWRRQNRRGRKKFLTPQPGTASD